MYPYNCNFLVVALAALDEYYVGTRAHNPGEASNFLVPIACPSGGGGYSIYPWVGRCGLAPHTLTLLKKKIADFPTLFKTEFRFLIPSLRHS